MLNGMARFVFGNVLIGALRKTHVARGPIRFRVRLVTIVGIDNVTGGAARRTKVARMIVGAEKVERRIKQSRFLYSQKNWIRSLVSAKSTRAQALVGLSRIFVFVGNADFQAALAAALKNAQHIAWLGDLP